VGSVVHALMRTTTTKHVRGMSMLYYIFENIVQ
jgi:hypothetical protein